MNKEVETALTRARIHLVMNQPFFGTLALYLHMQEGKVPTIGTDGTNLYYNPEFIEQLYSNGAGLDQLIGVICHEVMHCCLNHIWRCQTRNKMIFNIAADFAVNLLVKDSGLRLPQDCLYDLKFKDMSAEEIYAKIIKDVQEKQQQSEGNGEGNGEGKEKNEENGMSEQLWGDHEVWKEVSKKEIEKMQEEWKDRVVQAAESSKTRGKCPAGIERMINAMLYPKLDWRKALAAFMRPSKSDYSWSPPDRRFLNDEYDYLVLPDFNEESVEDVCIAIDSSGSIGGRELEQFNAEIHSILNSYAQFRGWLVYCDAEVHSFTEIERNSVRPVPQGGGGTSFIPVFEEIAKRGLDPSCLIYLTDGYGSFPREAPSYPVLWVSTTKDMKYPFGGVVELEIS
jgi:predicted metal-dependent peptidase